MPLCQIINRGAVVQPFMISDFVGSGTLSQLLGEVIPFQKFLHGFDVKKRRYLQRLFAVFKVIIC